MCSSPADVFKTENAVRQRFVALVNQLQDLDGYLSKNRCLAIMETGETHQWRIWQIIKQQKSLANVLRQSLAEDNVKKIAAVLFIVMDKFLSFIDAFPNQNFKLSLRLEQLALEDNKVIFIDFLPLLTITDSEIKDAQQHIITQAFQQIVIDIMNHPSIDNKQVLQYFNIFSNETTKHQKLVEILTILFKEN